MQRFIGLLLMLAAASGHAQVLDAIGPTYPIRERSMLEQIQRRLHDLEQSGELARMQRESRQRAVAMVRNPLPVQGLVTAQAARVKYYDPSFTLDRNVFDARGHLQMAAGTRRNPLELVPMPRRLLFFDARDPRQVARARTIIDQLGAAAVKPVLVGGSYADLMKRWRIPVYYDQQGTLVRRLRIEQVPALVSQEGMRLRIDELETK